MRKTFEKIRHSGLDAAQNEQRNAAALALTGSGSISWDRETGLCATSCVRKGFSTRAWYPGLNSERRPLLEQALLAYECDHLRHAVAAAQIGQYKRPRAAHAPGVLRHHFQAGPDIGRQIDLIDD